MPTDGRTGLVIPVPAADALLELVEAQHPGSVRQGAPAHVSLLVSPDGYPRGGVLFHRRHKAVDTSAESLDQNPALVRF